MPCRCSVSRSAFPHPRLCFWKHEYGNLVLCVRKSLKEFETGVALMCLESFVQTIRSAKQRYAPDYARP